MILVIQRVSRAQVEVDEKVVGKIGPGLLVFLGAEKGDDNKDAEEAARKVAGLRVFEDDQGKMNRDISEVAGSVLVVSQFTLAADFSRGRRPGFDRALAPEAANLLYEKFLEEIRRLGLPVESGVFGAMMRVTLVNEGPATFILSGR